MKRRYCVLALHWRPLSGLLELKVIRTIKWLGSAIAISRILTSPQRVRPAVADYLMDATDLQTGRMTITGLADTKPIADNSTPEGRAKIDGLNFISMSDFVELEECPPGSPPWMSTFADLATLLMAFFVLIVSQTRVADPDEWDKLGNIFRESIGLFAEQGGDELPQGDMADTVRISKSSHRTSSVRGKGENNGRCS